jgi:hypothetical protein
MKGRYRYRNKKSRDDKIRRTSQLTVLKSGYTVNQTGQAAANQMELYPNNSSEPLSDLSR